MFNRESLGQPHTSSLYSKMPLHALVPAGVRSISTREGKCNKQWLDIASSILVQACTHLSCLKVQGGAALVHWPGAAPFLHASCQTDGPPDLLCCLQLCRRLCSRTAANMWNQYMVAYVFPQLIQHASCICDNGLVHHLQRSLYIEQSGSHHTDAMLHKPIQQTQPATCAVTCSMLWTALKCHLHLHTAADLLRFI